MYIVISVNANEPSTQEKLRVEVVRYEARSVRTHQI
jgi:hypothetical protein